MGGKTAGADDFLEKVQAIAQKEGRYCVQAYLFVFEALEFTLKRIGKRRHVTGQELLNGIRDFALINFGAMGHAVFNQWGIDNSRDFGRIVFALVEAGLMSKTDTDSPGDFDRGFDFADTFDKQYVPAGIAQPQQPRSKPPEK